MRTRRVLLLFCFFSLFGLRAQHPSNLDSLKTVYNAQPDDTVKVHLAGLICQIVTYSNPEEVFKYGHEQIAISKRLNYKFGISQGANNLGSYYLNRNELDSALYYRQLTLDLVTETNSLMGIITANTQLGVLYTHMNDFKKAKEYLQNNIELYAKRDSLPHAKKKDFRYIGSTYNQLAELNVKQGQYNIALKNQLLALKLYKETGEELFIADANTALGRIERLLGNYDKSIAYSEEALLTYQKFDDLLWECEVRQNIGQNLLNLKRPTDATLQFEKVAQIAAENNFKLLEAGAYNLLGQAHTEMSRFDTALDFLKKSLALYEDNHPSEINDTYNSLGILFTKMGQPEEGIPYLNKSIAISDSINATAALARAYLNRSEAKERLKDPLGALSDFKKYNSINDSVFNTVKSQQIEELRSIHDTEKKEQQIALKDQEITVLEQKASINNLQRIILGFALLLAFILLYALRQKMKRSKLEKEKITAELSYKKKELTSHALHLAKKNEILESVKQKAKELKLTANDQGYQQLIKTINFDQQDDKNWENFTQYFEQVHKDFSKNVKSRYPEVTKNELRFMALIKMNMSSKEIATILNISADGIKKARQRLRKKMRLNPKDSLENSILEI